MRKDKRGTKKRKRMGKEEKKVERSRKTRKGIGKKSHISEFLTSLIIIFNRQIILNFRYVYAKT